MHKSFKINITSEGFDRILCRIYKFQVGFSARKRLDTSGPVTSASNAVAAQHEAPEAAAPGKGHVLRDTTAQLANGMSCCRI